MAKRSTLLLAAGYLSGLGLLGYLLQQSPTAPTVDTEAMSDPVPPLELPASPISNIAAYEAMVERPLFTPTRRPTAVNATPVPVDDEDVDPVEEIDGFRLAAVLKGLGSMTALIEDDVGATRTIHLGEQLGKWELTEILDDRVVLSADGRRQTLRVHQFEKAPPRLTRRAPPRRRLRPPLGRPPLVPIPPDIEPPEDDE